MILLALERPLLRSSKLASAENCSWTKRLVTGRSSDHRCSGTSSSIWKGRARQLCQPVLPGLPLGPCHTPRESRRARNTRYYWRKGKSSARCQSQASPRQAGHSTVIAQTTKEGNVPATPHLVTSTAARGDPLARPRDLSRLARLSSPRAHSTSRTRVVEKAEGRPPPATRASLRSSTKRAVSWHMQHH